MTDTADIGFDVSRPIPRPSEYTQTFWDATAEHRFLIQRCNACSNAIFYPRVTCTSCGSDDLAWEEASGRATVFTFTVARRPTHGAFAGSSEPSVIAIVELAEGPHVTTNIVGCKPAAVHIGMAVEVTFGPTTNGIAIPLFRPAAG